jgi:hypothetical protein
MLKKEERVKQDRVSDRWRSRRWPREEGEVLFRCTFRRRRDTIS